MIRLDFSIELEYQILEPSEFELMLHAASTSRQRIIRESFETHPITPVNVETLPFYGNRHARLHTEPGSLTVRYAALVEIEHLLVPPTELQEVPVRDLPASVLHFVRPSRYCPSDGFFDLAVQEFGALPPGYRRVQAIADWVRNRTRFRAGTTNSFHCATDTFTNQVGVCRDFAHLMISICRALNVPARYVTGIDFGADPALGPMDFHAYVEVYLSRGWYIFDPTGIVVPTGLLRIATGRDANDVAFATIFGRVLWSMPKVRIVALEDRSAGIALPAPTDLAISTSGTEDWTNPLHQQPGVLQPYKTSLVS